MLSKFPVLYEDGRIELIENLTLEEIQRVLGNFTFVRLNEDIAAYVKEDALFNESEEPNHVMCSFGSPILGPVILINPEDDGDGNTLPPEATDDIKLLLQAAEIYHEARQQIVVMRQSPFVAVAFTYVTTEGEEAESDGIHQ